MAEYKIYDVDTAPPDSKPLLENSLKGFGMIPNLHGVMAESPQMLEAYQVLTGLFRATSLSKTEQHVLWLTNNYTNNCHYCMPAHTGLAYMDDVDEDVISAMREGRALADGKLEALRQFTIAVIEKRGAIAEAEHKAFLDAGYSRQNVLEVILCVAHKVLSNYTNHIADTPVDDAFAKFDWAKPEAA